MFGALKGGVAAAAAAAADVVLYKRPTMRRQRALPSGRFVWSHLLGDVGGGSVSVCMNNDVST